MANETTGTTAAAFIPELWSSFVQVARESTFIMANLVRRFDSEVLAYGDQLHVPNLSNFTATAISTSDGSLANSVNTESTTDLLINKWMGVKINVLDIVKAQAKPDLMKHFTQKMGYALGLVVETDLTALAASFSQTVGTFNTDFTDANLRRAIQYLDDALVPFEDRHFGFKPAGRNILLGIDKFVRYDAIPMGRGESPILKGNVGEIYGARVHISPNVYKTSNDTSNFLMHRDALGLAMQKKAKIEQWGKTNFGDTVAGQEIYGVKEMRDDHAVEIRS